MERVLQIVEALDDAGVPCSLAGGWGIDALVGKQTRRHDDVDIVLMDFSSGAEQACEALAKVGFRLIDRYRHANWMPDQWTLEDDTACRIDLLSIDWGRLEEAMGTVDPGLTMAEGAVGGRRVQCLSAAVQRIFHSGFEPRPVDTHDLFNLMARSEPTAGSQPSGGTLS